ncbi:hypothetical protein BDV95DRAFT_569812 [Massariosphaeria phaeospora]|uniref:GPI anchored serine-threonine rich protein n=1 Tax=Massariosphaeria phaeospora TaxID=100035 RepID=A0A7C8IAU5_9PLEO|nr:hypothetical protein BDV95DRAFT_569812 [Massariosphaeria phaeospora]
MRTTLFSLLFSATFSTLAFAQQTSSTPSSSTTSECEAQNIVDVCSASIQKQVDACDANDWMCLCDNYTALLTCYDNCPKSDDRAPVQTQVTQFCAAAAPIKSASLASVATAGTKAAAQATSAMPTGSQVTQTATGTEATGIAFSTGAARALSVPVGGSFAVLIGIAGLL